MTWARLALAATCVAVAVAFAMSGGCSAEAESPAGDAKDGGGDAAAEATTTKDAGVAPPLGPAVECTIGAAIEQEPNDTPATANAFTELSFCGVLESGTDVDYSTFTTPTGKKLTVFQGVITGKVDFELTLDGATFGPTETDRFSSGTYVVKAYTSAGKPAAYRIRVQFD